MTSAQLDEIILAADTNACGVFFETMTEAQRKLLSARASQWLSVIRGYMFCDTRRHLGLDKAIQKDIELYESIASKNVVFPEPISASSLSAAQMALLATCAFPELKKIGLLGIPQPNLAVKILSDRKPLWLDKWCKFVVVTASTSHWVALHDLEKLGICFLERDAGYWRSMLATLSHNKTMFETVLLKDETVVAEILPMLEDPGVRALLCEPEQFTSDSFKKRWRSGADIFAPRQTFSHKGCEVWRDALCQCAARGLLDKERLIDFSFASLSEAAEKSVKSSIYQSVSTADFAIKLNQTLTEGNRAAYLSRYASLLGATHRDISTYCSNVLIEMPEATLALSEICSCIQSAFLNKHKEPAETALKLIARLAKDNAHAKSEYGPALLAALSHTSKEVLRKGIALIESTAILEDPQLLAEYKLRIEVLTGMERSTALKLAEKYQSAAGTLFDTKGVPTTDAVLDTPASLEDLILRSSVLDHSLKSLALVNDALEAIQNHKRLDAPVRLDSLSFPRLNPEAVLAQISNLDDLVYAFMRVFSGKCTAIELEIVLDGVSRLSTERPRDFEEKTAMIREKTRSFLEEPGMFGFSRTFAHLGLVWLDASTVVNSPRISQDSSAIYTRRCFAVTKRVASKIAAPLLALPTHAGGWIEPQALVNRLLKYVFLKIEPDELDFVQALLRLAPDNRAGALESARQIKGEMGKALRYALGDGELLIGHMPEYWVAAFRSRDPKGTSPELVKALGKFGPDGAQAAIYGFDPEPISSFASDRYSSISGGLPNFLPVRTANESIVGDGTKPLFAIAPPPHSNKGSYNLCPTVLLHENGNSLFSGIQTYNWLHNRESLLALYAKRTLCNIHSVGSYWHGEYELLFDPDISMAENGRYFICLAMSSKNNDLSRLAVDILISAVGDCRIGANDYGLAMASFLPWKLITYVRWVRGLRDTSKVSALHAHFVWKSLDALIRSSSAEATSLIPFLELFLELRLEHKFGTGEALKDALSDIAGGGGKSAKLAKAILICAANPEHESKAAMQALESRIKRVERWQSWSV